MPLRPLSKEAGLFHLFLSGQISQKPAVKVFFVKFFPLSLVLFVLTLSLVAGQTAPAPSTPSSTTGQDKARKVLDTGQIGPGTAGTISNSQGVTPTPSTSDKAHKILNNALTRETRQTLQAAMNSVTPPFASANTSSGTSTRAAPPAAGH